MTFITYTQYYLAPMSQPYAMLHLQIIVRYLYSGNFLKVTPSWNLHPSNNSSNTTVSILTPQMFHHYFLALKKKIFFFLENKNIYIFSNNL